MVSETVTELPISDEVLQRYSTDRPAKILNLFHPALVGDGIMNNVGMTVKGKITAFSVRLSQMGIRTKFLLKDGHMVPDFGATSAQSTEFTMVWDVLDNMNLYLMITLDAPTLCVGDCWLIAYDRNGKYYRIPTTNTYDDGKVCMGKYDQYGTSLLDCCIKAYAQFRASPWNSDLNDRGDNGNAGSGMANSMELFRFKPLEPDGFQMVRPEKDWTLLSTRINSEFVNQHITLV